LKFFNEEEPAQQKKKKKFLFFNCFFSSQNFSGLGFFYKIFVIFYRTKQRGNGQSHHNERVITVFKSDFERWLLDAATGARHRYRRHRRRRR